jgi:hypothetical protein
MSESNIRLFPDMVVANLSTMRNPQKCHPFCFGLARNITNPLSLLDVRAWNNFRANGVVGDREQELEQLRAKIEGPLW